jgi:hypothetical protein
VDRRAHCPVLPAVDLEVVVAIAGSGRRVRPWSLLADLADQDDEGDKVVVEFRPPLRERVLVGDMGHGAGELPSDLRDVGTGVVDGERHVMGPSWAFLRWSMVPARSADRPTATEPRQRAATPADETDVVAYHSAASDVLTGLVVLGECSVA